MIEFKFPDVGEGIQEGEVVKWLVKEGDNVKQDDVIVKIETDKAVVDIPSPVSGKISKINFKEGQVVKVGQVLVVIDDGKKSVEPKKETIIEKPLAEKRKSVGVIGELEEAKEDTVETKIIKKESIEKENKVLALLSVRKLAKEKGIDLSLIKGTGKKGDITKEDVENYNGEKSKSVGIKVEKKYDLYGYVDRIPLKGVRKTIAANMLRSFRETAPVTSMIEVDVTHLSDIREKQKENAKKQDVKLTFLPFIVKSVVEALNLHPYVNSSIENEEIILKKYYNIGIAVDTEVGLIVPVIKRAEQKDIMSIAKEIVDLSNKVKDRSIDIADLKGGTFTITNYGSIGGNYGTPIINYPECAILGIGRIEELPRVIEGKIMIRKILPLSVTFDHRIVDGAEIARFVVDVKKRLEDPAMMLV
ncbi:2-oxo acid dehydrogenase subunit E2 [Candidatus Woesearchaeota archaeon]|nr:2-oxo acid dehydrogenase subunit E2 [Candidatus Woesearchaeota archaeon]